MRTAAGITLPLAFSRDTSASLPEIHAYAAACIQFLSSDLVSALLECHPNDIAIYGPRPEWQAWWQWASTGRWKTLVPGWVNSPDDSDPGVPRELALILKTAHQLALPRTLSHKLIPEGHAPLRGMSPKKAHEVLQMSAFIQSVLSQTQTDIRYAVDIGAGQGYLSRSLSSFPLSMDVLALDSSEVQIRGAERRGKNIQKQLAKSASNEGVDSPVPGIPDSRTHAPNRGTPSLITGSLTHQMTTITPQTLHSSVSHWLSDKSAPAEATPVLFVALHACGTLTPDILRCFLANQKTAHPSPGLSTQPSWHAAALVVIGCCYNLMSPDIDFPLSGLVSSELSVQENKLHLSYNHRSLAAQSPLQWALNDSTKTAAELAVRKVVYRALFGKFALAHDHHMKVGRLRDSAYSSFDAFVSEASNKTGVQVFLTLDKEGLEELTSCLEVLHVLRSRIGPVVESLIIVDRYLYLVENVPNSDVYAFNLFNQELGSGRNNVLAVFPHRAHSNM